VSLSPVSPSDVFSGSSRYFVGLLFSILDYLDSWEINILYTLLIVVCYIIVGLTSLHLLTRVRECVMLHVSQQLQTDNVTNETAKCLPCYEKEDKEPPMPCSREERELQ
jgi:hypothetical protein